MKPIAIILLFILYPLSINAQWGVKIGGHLSSIEDLGYNKYKTSIHVGGTYELKLAEKWYLQPELQFTTVGHKIKNDNYLSKGGHVEIHALELPVNFSFRPTLPNDFKLLFDMGLYTRLGLFGNKTYKYYDLEKVDESPFDAFSRFDAGLNLGIGLQKKRYYGVFSFQQGFVHAEKDINVYHRVFKFSLGYKF